MKKIFIALAAVAGTFAFSACEDKLDIPQEGVVAQENFYITDADAQSALTSAYYMAGRFYSNTMWTTAGWNDSPLLSMWEYASDDIFVAGSDKTDGQSGQEIQSFVHDMNSALITGTYECYYMIINAANLVICNFENKSNITPVQKRCVAEARVLRAQAQLLLALGWGTAPIVDHILAGDEKPGNASSQADVLQWIADECDKAIGEGLTSKSSVNDKKGAVICTKEFALALKGKALLNKKDYAGAKTALKQVIESKKYELVPGSEMSSLNHFSGRANKEVVFELNYLYEGSLGNYGRTQPNFRLLWNWRTDKIQAPTGNGTEVVNNGWGWCNPSQKFVDKLLAYDGYDSYRRKAWVKSYDEVLYEMPYSNDTDGMTLADKQKDTKRGINANTGLYGHCGYFMWKRLFRQEDATENTDVANWNTNIMRYAEVLLLYAEACAMTGDSDGSGLAALKTVNERAGSKTPVTACNMETVKTEKFLECWLDGTRFQDLVRWGDAKKELGDAMSGGKYYPSFKDAMFTLGEETHRGYLDTSDADWCVKAKKDIMGFKEGKNELFPFPFAELNVNPNLKQNPGY